MHQLSIHDTNYGQHTKPTHKSQFLARMETLMPWQALEQLIEPHYPKAGNGRRPIGLNRMLRMYLISQWFNLSDNACEEALYDVLAFRHFCRFDLGNETIPDATTLENFRHMLERHKLGAAMFELIGALLMQAGLKVSKGTIVDATNARASRGKPLSDAVKIKNRNKSKIRAKVEHPFLWLKRIWGFAKARYRGLDKNANRAFVLLALFNIKKWNRPLTP